MVEAIDKMMTDKLSEEITKFVEDRKALAMEKTTYKENVGAHSAKLESFVMNKLAEELNELNVDRKSVHENFSKLEEFVVGALAKEIKEFHEDKKGVVETKVKLVKEAKSQMKKLKDAFITKSAKVVEDAVTKKLGEELTQLKEDITAARQINFGKRVFEAFASEYQSSYLNEKSETSKLLKVVDEQMLKIEEAKKSIEEKQAVIESKEQEIARSKDLMERKSVMNEMLGTLSSDKKEVMRSLLESVRTPKLREAFDKYLPAVIDGYKKKATTEKVALTESIEVTGDKESKSSVGLDDILDIRKLAGLK
jgi:predicted component of type VI protein secretion system